MAWVLCRPCFRNCEIALCETEGINLPGLPYLLWREIPVREFRWYPALSAKKREPEVCYLGGVLRHDSIERRESWGIFKTLGALLVVPMADVDRYNPRPEFPGFCERCEVVWFGYGGAVELGGGDVHIF